MSKKRSFVLGTLTFLLLVLMTNTAMGASSRFVPTVAKTYSKSNGKWKLSYTRKFTYKNDGKIIKYQYSRAHTNETRNYTWNGDYIIRYDYSGQGKGTTMFSYSKGLRQSEVFSSEDEKTTYSYKWEKGKASVKYKTINTWGEDAGISSITTKVNNKKKIISVKTKYKNGTSNTITSSYYKNGNLKEEKTVFEKSSTISKYNKDGYIESLIQYTGSDITSSIIYKYTYNQKKKCPKSVLIITEDGYGNKTQQKTVFSSFKKVRHVRNCDSSGYSIPLGENLF